MRPKTEWEKKFPKFLIADSEDDRTFVIHLHYPRFVGEVVEECLAAVKIQPEFIDQLEGMDAPEMAKLMREAGDFYMAEIEREQESE